MHEQAANFAQVWGTVYMVALFLGAVVYALWPANKKTFDRAAHAPLDAEDDDAAHN